MGGSGGVGIRSEGVVGKVWGLLGWVKGELFQVVMEMEEGTQHIIRDTEWQLMRDMLTNLSSGEYGGEQVRHLCRLPLANAASSC